MTLSDDERRKFAEIESSLHAVEPAGDNTRAGKSPRRIAICVIALIACAVVTKAMILASDLSVPLLAASVVGSVLVFACAFFAIFELDHFNVE